jgi:hypothetical protein
LSSGDVLMRQATRRRAAEVPLDGAGLGRLPAA